jgi:hypothetical protein
MATQVPVSLQQRSRLRSTERKLPSWPSPLTFWASGPLDVTALRDVLRALVRRHDALRTVFVAGVDDHALTLPPAEVDVPFEVRDVGPLDDETVRQLVIADLHAGVDVERGPLLRATVLRLDEARHVVAITVDHIAFDGISSDRLVSELAALYETRIAGTAEWESAAGPVPMSYADFCVRQERLVHGAWGEACREHWHTNFARFDHYPPLGGVAVAGVPVDLGYDQSSGRKVVRQVDPPFLDAVHTAARKGATTRFVVWTALLLRALARAGTHVNGVVTDVHGRIVPGSGSTIGLFSHGAPLYARVGAGQSLADAVTAVRPGALGLMKYALPLRELSHAWVADQRPTEMETVDTRPFLHFLDEAAWRFDRRLGPVSLRYFVPYGVGARPRKGPNMLAFKLERLDQHHYLTAQFDARVNDPVAVEQIVEFALGQD